MKKIFFNISLLSLFALFFACESADEVSINTGLEFTKGEFTDQRDNKTYSTITINGQTWMTENLAYRIEAGALGGCYAYYEDDVQMADVKIDNMEFQRRAQEFVASGEIVEIPNPNTYTSIISMINTIKPITNIQFLLANILTYYDQLLHPEYLVAYEILNEIYLDLVIEAIPPFAALMLQEADLITDSASVRCGLLYKEEALEMAIPEGWRLPTDEDWLKLEKALGMESAEADMIEEWRGIGDADILDVMENVYGFKMQFGGIHYYGDVPQHSQYPKFVNLDTHGYFWTSTAVDGVEQDSYFYIIRKIYSGRNTIFRGTAHPEAALSVRLIKE